MLPERRRCWLDDGNNSYHLVQIARWSFECGLRLAIERDAQGVCGGAAGRCQVRVELQGAEYDNESTGWIESVSSALEFGQSG